MEELEEGLPQEMDSDLFKESMATTGTPSIPVVKVIVRERGETASRPVNTIWRKLPENMTGTTR